MILPVAPYSVTCNKRCQNLNSVVSNNSLTKASISQPSFTGNRFVDVFRKLFKSKNVNFNKMSLNELEKYPALNNETSVYISTVLRKIEILDKLHQLRGKKELFKKLSGNSFFESLKKPDSHEISIKAYNKNLKEIVFTQNGDFLNFKTQYGDKTKEMLIGINVKGDNKYRLLSYKTDESQTTSPFTLKHSLVEHEELIAKYARKILDLKN